MERTQEAAYEGEWSFKLTSNYNSDSRELILSGIPVEKGTTYEPKSVIRHWGDCPLVSCSMLLA